MENRRHERIREVDSTRRRRDGTDINRHWFFSRGLLGVNFRWDRWQEHLTPGQPCDLHRLRNDIAQMTEADPEFLAQARSIALEALDVEDPDTLCRAFQVLCVVGTEEDLARLSELVVTDPEVSKHLKSSLFARGVRKK